MADESSNIDFSSLAQAPAAPYEDEALFARDIDGRLIRVERATARDFDTDVKLRVDGQEVIVKMAVPLRDSQGNILRDALGKPTPRYTTIYDAASQLFVRQPGDRNPIPTLCHKEHLPPVGVCRVCVVEAAEQTRRGRRTRLVPACVQRVSDGMEVNTLESAADPQAATRVRQAVSTLVELLASDHLPTQEGRFLDPQQAGLGNELAALAARLGISQSRFSSLADRRGSDHSSTMIAVDHDQCILCGRCARGCNWVKGNKVIGRSAKGYASLISFDLGQPLGSSSCVSCGECAISCPTGALEFTPEFMKAQFDIVRQAVGTEHDEIVTAEELIKLPLFSGIPYKFLQFNGGAVIRRKLTRGEVLCEEGDYGATAFIILSGRFEAFISSARGAVRSEAARGLRGWLGGFRTFAQKVGGEARLADLSSARLNENERIIRTPADVILGEMSCMNRYPRSATVVALEDAEVLEIRRNVLHMLQRSAASRQVLDRVYRERALAGQLENLPLLKELDDESRRQAAEFLRDKADILFVEPGQEIIVQGDRARDFFITKLGFVKVTQEYGRESRVLNYLGPGRYFGEIGLLSEAHYLLAGGSEDEENLAKCTATCSALDHVELVRIRGNHFHELLTRFPNLSKLLAEGARQLLQRDEETRHRLDASNKQDFLDQGLFLAQSLLVLDLDRCTRCDECTKACADTHDGITRLVREGMRFDRFLIASSCRSCLDPYCLVGCPVDAIHRHGETLEIEIKDYCIGCGLCADNCPYGNINMHGFPKMESDPKTGRTRQVYQNHEGVRRAVIQQRATTCDLCHSIDGRPSCVYACPHNAAFRMTGADLQKVLSGSVFPRTEGT